MTAPIFTEIDAPRVCSVGYPKQSGKAIRLVWHEDQMHVIRHQAVSQHINADLGLVLGQQIQISLIVFVQEEGFLAPISSLRDVMRVVGNHNSGHPCHRETPTVLKPG